MQTINVRIKTFPGKPPRPATTRVQLPKLTADQRQAGMVERPLEPGEVVSMPKEMALDFLAHLEHELEITVNDPTRPIYFNDAFEAERTSENFRPGVQPRSEEVKADVRAQRERMAEQMKEAAEAKETGAGTGDASVDPDAPIDPNDVEAAMRLLKERGYTVSDAAPVEDAETEDLVEEPDTYTPENNAILPAEVDEERRKYQEEQAKADATTEEKPKRKRRKPAAKVEDGPPPATKRRRRGTNS